VVPQHFVALATVADGVANGKILPSEAQALSAVVTDYAKVTEMGELESRLAVLENERREAETKRHYDA
jgi:hypothetical protein